MGRKRKDKAVERARKLLAKGVSFRDAAKVCKIAPSTITRAIQREPENKGKP